MTRPFRAAEYRLLRDAGRPAGDRPIGKAKGLCSPVLSFSEGPPRRQQLRLQEQWVQTPRNRKKKKKKDLFPRKKLHRVFSLAKGGAEGEHNHSTVQHCHLPAKETERHQPHRKFHHLRCFSAPTRESSTWAEKQEETVDQRGYWNGPQWLQRTRKRDSTLHKSLPESRPRNHSNCPLTSSDDNHPPH